jgi:hypothetical protein
VPALRIPLSTYRLQMNSRFRFQDAAAIVDYLHALGITDCYASSYLAAVPGSPHGYDVVDPTRLNPEIGTEEDYWAWMQAIRSHGMGHILDLVPNHMGIAKSANPWWQDVLENGPSSRFARFFECEISCWIAMSAARRSSFSSCGTGSPSASAPEPGSGEYVKTPTLSKRTASRNPSTSEKSSSVSPGNPTMNVERIESPGSRVLIPSKILR